GKKQSKVLEFYKVHRAQGLWKAILRRSLIMSFAYVIFGWALFFLTDWPNMPYRGDVVHGFAWIALALAVVAVVVSTFFTFDALNECCQFVKQLEQRREWDADAPGMAQLIKGKGIPSGDADSLGVARDLLTIKLIAKRTHGVGQLVKYPYIVVL